MERIVEKINYFIRLLTFFKPLHTRQWQLNLCSDHFATEAYTPPCTLPLLTMLLLQKIECSKKRSYIITFVLCKNISNYKVLIVHIRKCN